MFRKETYIQRRNELKTKVQKGIILFFGNSESSMNYADNTYHFRQDSTFLYYTGLSQPDLALTIDLETGEEVLYGDNFGIDSIVWMGTQPSIAERAALAGISKTNAFSELSQTFLMAKKQNRTIHFIPPYRGETRIQLFELLGIHPSEIGKNASVELIKAVASQRNYKTNEEIAEIEKAANLTTDMHVAGMRLLKPGMNEAQIAAEVTKIALAANGNLSFPVIATINGQTLHNHFHGNIAQSGQLFLLDCGAETEMGYAGDMSSTFPVGAKFTSEQRVIYEIALASHQKAVSMLKPGITNREVHLAACTVIAQGMKDLGLMKGNISNAVEAGAHAMFFPCGTGHMMGMDVHDMENLGEQYVGYAPNQERSKLFGLKSLRLAKALEPGFVLTIEPGIYFIPELIDYWKSENRFSEFLNYEAIEKYRNFGGCRNEEDYLITETGAKRLGKYKPMTVEEVENERSIAF